MNEAEWTVGVDRQELLLDAISATTCFGAPFPVGDAWGINDFLTMALVTAPGGRKGTACPSVT